MVRDVVSLRQSNPLLGGVEGVGPESLDFFRAPNRPRLRLGHFTGTKKNLDFQGPPLQLPLEMDSTASN